MKIAQRIVAFLLILITFSFLLASCAPEETRGELDKTNITVLEVGMDSSLIKEKVFSSETSKLHYSFRFGSTIDVQSIRFRAYYDGKYKFNMADGYKASIYAHTGSITTDFWEDLPCEQSLKAGYEYTIEIKIHNASDVNKDLTLEVETPATNTKDISDCISFVDDYFSYFLKDGELYRLDRRHPSFTDMKKGEELFYIVTMPIEEDILSFCRAAAEKSAAQDYFINLNSETDELLYLSCTPTLHISSLTNEHDSGSDDAIPRIAWGKYRDINGKKELGLSVEVNHRFIDGVHIGRFAKELEKLMEEL